MISPVDVVARLFPSFQEAERSWRLIEQDGDCYVFQTFDWLSQWYHHMGKPMGVTPCLVLVETIAAEPLMLFPFGIRKHSFLRSLVWLGDEITGYQAPLLGKGSQELLDRTVFEAIWRQVLDVLPPVDYLHLEKQPVSVGRLRNPMTHLPCRRQSSRAHATRLQGSWDSYYKSKAGKKTRKNCRRDRNKLQKLGELKILCPATGSERDRVVETMFRQKSQFYRELGVMDLFASEHRRRFVRYMTKAFADSGLVHVAAIQVDDQIVATYLGLSHGDRFYGLIPSYAQGATARLSPGTLILHAMLSWAIENGFAVYDFGIGDDPYKNRWCEEKIDIYDSIIPMNLRGRAAAAILVTRLLLKRYVKNSVILLNLAKALRRKIPRRRPVKTT